MSEWDEFPDAWSDFPDAEEPAPKKAKPKKREPRRDLSLETITRPIDGDTVGLASGANLRLWGVDAPELQQQGWDRNMVAVPIGQQATLRLSDLLRTGTPMVGQEAMQSYGRPVAPISVDGIDVGQSLARSGNALSAPEYLEADPSRRFSYVQAERLARQNRLGVHGVAAQTPAEHRDNPDYVPERETVAQFFDTPTPHAGLTADQEQEWIAVLQSGTAEEIEAKADSLGYGIDVERNREWVANRDKVRSDGGDVPAYVRYTMGPAPVVELGDGAGAAAIRGYGSGFLASGLDEAGAFADMLGLPAGDGPRENIWNSDRRLADIWANNQSQNAAILRGDDAAHPYASATGEVAGALTSGFLMPYGRGATTAPQLAKVGAVWGGTEGFLGTDGVLVDRAKGAIIGAPIGAIADPALGKAVEFAAPLVSKAYRGLRGRAGEAVEGVSGRLGRTAPESAPAASQADEWAEFPDVGSDGGPVVETPAASQVAATQRAIGMEADGGPSISADLPKTQRMDQPASEAVRRAASESLRPGEVLPIPGNQVSDVEEAAAIGAGRFVEAKAPNERDELSRTTVRNFVGREVPKVGPIDLVGWLRLNGGLRDQGGELAHMGIVNNAPRRGMEHVGQEARFGPMVRDGGMNFDDAALGAWEAGYFPEQSDRPDINTFLDAVRETYNGGSGRRFLPEDMPELEAFDARQSERFQLERMRAENDAPIYDDVSQPANEPQPFAPPQAYEEWPDGGPDFAGNIALDRLDSPQDIKRALAQTERRIGFDAATRGRVSNAETEALAADLDMSVDQLLKRRNGEAFNAEEALKARQILAKSGNELVNAAKKLRGLGDDPGARALAEFRHKWLRHVAIQEQVAGMTAEAGRALQQFRMTADSRAIRNDVLEAMVRAGGGRENLTDAADILIDAVEIGPGKFNALTKQTVKPKWHNKVGEFYINMLLSNPPTHVVNMVSNTLTAIAQIPEYGTAALLGAGRKAVLREKAADRVLASEIGARAVGLIQGAKEGAQLFAKALRTGEADDFASKVEGDEFKAISGVKGEIIRIPTRLLTAEDQLFKGIARRMEINAQAVRIASKEGLKGEAAKARIAELSANPTEEMLERSLDYGRYLTFQRKLGGFGQDVSRASSRNLIAKVIVPFVRTPINLLKFATERSPAAPILKEWRQDFLAGGESRDLAVAKMLLGTGFAAAIYEAALDGRITGGVPADPAKAKLLYADGWQPYSIKIGDRYVSYSRMDPFSTTIGVAADMATLPSGLSDKQSDDKATMLVASIMGNLANKTWLSGVSSLVEGLADPGRYAGNWLERTAGAFAVPAGVAGVARQIDPIARIREGVGDAVKARVPGMSQDLYPRRDIFGEPIETDSLGPDLISPFWQSKAKDDPVVAEMLRIGKSVSAPGKQYTDEGVRTDYTPEEYDRYHEIAGRLTYNGLHTLVSSSEYQTMDDDARRKAAKKAIGAARKSAREVLDDPAYQLPERGAADEWGTFPDAGKGEASNDPWSEFEDAPQRDVVGELQKAIPGVGITSGYRTAEYQADMRRRGYKPARNSAHLDGSALDLTPPPGRSMGWLRAQVMKIEPKADVLPEGDHLHVAFPDWQGAPVLGGARSAGLVNPAAGA